MKKKCLSCGAQFALSGSGKRQKYCPKCARRGMVPGRGLPGSKLLKTKGRQCRSDDDSLTFDSSHFRTPVKLEGNNIHRPRARFRYDFATETNRGRPGKLL